VARPHAFVPPTNMHKYTPQFLHRSLQLHFRVSSNAKKLSLKRAGTSPFLCHRKKGNKFATDGKVNKKKFNKIEKGADSDAMGTGKGQTTLIIVH